MNVGPQAIGCESCEREWIGMIAVGASGQSLMLREAGPTMSVTSTYRVRGVIGWICSRSVRSQELEQSTYRRASSPHLPNWKSCVLPLTSNRKTSLQRRSMLSSRPNCANHKSDSESHQHYQITITATTILQPVQAIQSGIIHI